MPLELAIKKTYGGDIYYIDTIFHTCMFMLKTGPIKSVCCFGMTAPAGIMQISEEDGESPLMLA